MLKAVIFDFDGVIVDSEPLHYRAFQELLKPEGLQFTWDDYMTFFVGFDDRDAFRTVFARAKQPLDDDKLKRLIEGKTVVFQQWVAESGVTAYPGVVELFRALSGKYPVGLCSGALRSDVNSVLAKLGIAKAIDVFVTADDVHVSKPDPTCYRLCVQKLADRYPTHGIQAGECVAIEDTPSGIEAAKGAGLKVLAVSNSHPIHKLKDADRIVTSLADVLPTDLHRLTAEG
ncbi:MAG TPA: HAD family hydrolase [Verrucomicrobia bacterium]|nr:MAG: HAD family hydrolase [Lentisphaerae bacterium GWF2_57_35]HBA83981.1 HAD family hydrolase [Verrucomicrobiota bacterium]